MRQGAQQERARMIRRLAIELGSWRGGLNRGTAGPEVARWAEAWAAERTSGGKSAAFANQKAVSRDAQRAMMMEAPPAMALNVVNLKAKIIQATRR
jgi:hypothetical protein